MSAIGTKDLSKVLVGNLEVKSIYIGNTKVYQFDESGLDFLCFTAETAGATVELIKIGSPNISGTAYSTDKKNWVSFTPSTTTGTNTITLANIGDKVYFRNNINEDFMSYSRYLNFVMSGKIAASGNCNSIYSSSNFTNLTTLAYRYCYYRLFSGCDSLTTAPSLPATTLTGSCYGYMFLGCSSLTTAPDLPATSLASECYENMFMSCSKLAIAPELPATVLYYGCYMDMFANCTSLSTAPVLVATSLADGCYAGMFAGCTSLTTISKLPAIKLMSGCYTGMFRGCTSLYVSDTQVSEATYEWNIPSSGTFTNTTTYNQSGMFTSCLGTRSSNTMSGATGGSHTYYTQNEPVSLPNELCFTANTAGSTVELIANGSPSIANSAYSTDGKTWTTFTPSATSGTNTITLTNIGDKVYFRNDITGDFDYSNYMKFVMTGSISSSGNVNSIYSAMNYTNLTTLEYEYCYYSMFDGCTALIAAPELPATTLNLSCYEYMFQGCTSLTYAPALPATTLAYYCYKNMFSVCTSLITPPTLSATTLAPYCYNNMFNGCTSLVSAPALPATALASGCYSSMFSSCTSLYVSDASGTGYTQEWNIPSSGTFTNTATYNQSYMFYWCKGTRSSNTMSGAQGDSHTYYTQNEPIS